MNIFPTGTKTYFAQAVAPTGWVQDVSTGNDCMIRVVGSSASTGGTVTGTVAFSTAFASHTWAGTPAVGAAATGEVALDPTQIPAHGHNFVVITPATTAGGGGMRNNPPYPTPLAIHGTSGVVNYTIAPFPTGGNPHSHTLAVTGSSLTSTNTTDFSIQYINIILCTAS